MALDGYDASARLLPSSAGSAPSAARKLQRRHYRGEIRPTADTPARSPRWRSSSRQCSHLRAALCVRSESEHPNWRPNRTPQSSRGTLSFRPSAAKRPLLADVSREKKLRGERSLDVSQEQLFNSVIAQVRTLLRCALWSARTTTEELSPQTNH